ncbi:MAG TPA: hypothetical protein VK797_22985 [Tepidisphaeraceae bacterium]|jgi:hypothetical protein|nr:hypothetical protein [Tepidisphaeraceae bacterium]
MAFGSESFGGGYFGEYALSYSVGGNVTVVVSGVSATGSVGTVTVIVPVIRPQAGGGALGGWYEEPEQNDTGILGRLAFTLRAAASSQSPRQDHFADATPSLLRFNFGGRSVQITGARTFGRSARLRMALALHGDTSFEDRIARLKREDELLLLV